MPIIAVSDQLGVLVVIPCTLTEQRAKVQSLKSLFNFAA
jgi:hypothetical protein